MLDAVLREVRLTQGDAGVAQVFDGIAKRAVGKIAPALEGKSTLERLEAIADNIRGSGVSVDVEEHGDTIVLREHNCPYANVVSEHPECCTVIHYDARRGGLARSQANRVARNRRCRMPV